MMDRTTIAAMAMQGLIVQQLHYRPDAVATQAVKFADALIAELEKSSAGVELPVGYDLQEDGRILPKSEWKAPSFSYGDEHGSGFSHLK